MLLVTFRLTIIAKVLFAQVGDVLVRYDKAPLDAEALRLTKNTVLTGSFSYNNLLNWVFASIHWLIYWLV